MKAKFCIFYFAVVLATFLFSIGVYAVWNNFQANINTHQSNAAQPVTENLPAAKEINNSNDDKVISCSKRKLQEHIAVKAKRFISRKGSKCYRYTVENNTSQEIRGIYVGTEKSTDLAELVELPLGWSESPANPGLIESSDSKSLIEAWSAEGQDKIFILTKSFQVEAGKTNSFFVCVQNRWDSNYQTSHWIAYLHDGSDLAGKLINLDAK